jgi:SAM-dependent methyltransferase
MIFRTLIKLGTLLYRIDQAINVLLGRHKAIVPNQSLDKTGRVIQFAQRIQILPNSYGVCLIQYPKNYSHSLWRSQELTLFEIHKGYLERPCLDFGCGDGSFASMLFDNIDYGLDIDQNALKTAHQYGIYRTLACFDGTQLPVKAQALGSVFSNSVLEHAEDLEGALSGISHSLRPGGYFLFAVPVMRFAEHLKHFFGRKESDRINQRWYHRHLYSTEWWRELLVKYGFEIVDIRNYQPDWFTLAYFVLGTRSFRPLLRCGLSRKESYRRTAARMIAASIAHTTDGGNIFVIARRSHKI